MPEERVGDKEIGQVAGGKRDFQKALEQYKSTSHLTNKKCMFCGEPLEFTVANMELDNGRWAAYIENTCPECRKKHPYVWKK